MPKNHTSVELYKLHEVYQKHDLINGRVVLRRVGTTMIRCSCGACFWSDGDRLADVWRVICPEDYRGDVSPKLESILKKHFSLTDAVDSTLDI